MSRENVEFVKILQPSGVDLVEIFAEGVNEFPDDVDPEAFVSDFESRVFPGVPGMEQPLARGVDGLVAMWREWLTPWASFRLDAERFIDAGDDVVVFARVQSRTARDDVLVEHSPTAVWSIRDGKVVSIHFYLDRAEALEAVGLSEQDAHGDS
jgi:ketosteroid isomerase-like protein